MIERIRALIFDFDDTIVGSETLNAELLREFLLREYAIRLTPEEERETYWYSWKDTFPLLAEKFGFTADFDSIWPRFLETKERWLASHRMPVARGTDLILSLPVPRAIVSGSMRGEIELMMANVGLEPDRFDVLVTAEDCERRKPDPEGFLRALDAMRVRPAQALAFEDSPLGIEAARACGLPVAFMREFAAMDAGSGAEVCFDTFEQAYPWVRERLETGAGTGGAGRGAPGG